MHVLTVLSYTFRHICLCVCLCVSVCVCRFSNVLLYVEQCCLPVCRGVESPESMEVSDEPTPVDFHIIEKYATAWNLPVYYHDLHVIGAGRFGQVW